MDKPHYFAGIMSGTSLDAVDCVLADFSTHPPRMMHSHREPMPCQLRADILTLCQGQPVTLRQLGEAGIAIARLFAKAITTLIEEAGLAPAQVAGIGSHGQTVHHQPLGDLPFSMQIGDPSTIAALTGITTVADFRSKDVALGGQGAPLAPLFHQAAFASPDRQRVVLNLGGMANISVLTSRDNATLSGFDTGPANVLMDGWIQQCLGQSYDVDGTWASQGRCNDTLLELMLREPYLLLPPPKSTGRELFNQAWLQRHLAMAPDLAAVDVQATLLELTARSVCDSIALASPGCDEVIACGGGAYNAALMKRLQELLPQARVSHSGELGLAPDWVEAMTFAWLAEQTLARRAVDTGSVTGARRPCVLGGVYYAERP